MQLLDLELVFAEWCSCLAVNLKCEKIWKTCFFVILFSVLFKFYINDELY
jgi:hypothetical protein